MAIHLLTIVGRVALVYFGLLVLLRVGGKKELGEMSPMDLLTMLLLSETVQQAMIGRDASVIGGLVAAATLVLLSVLSGWLAFRSRRLEQLLEGDAAVLIDRGRVVEAVLRRHRMTDAQLRTALHHQQLLSVDQVERAFIEPTGKITFIKREEAR
jgi:uncharacterized membrane protein YcaP (DUF421 family)